MLCLPDLDLGWVDVVKNNLHNCHSYLEITSSNTSEIIHLFQKKTTNMRG